MEAGSSAPRRPIAPPSRALAPVREVGEITSFSGRALAAGPGAWRYFSEVLRQCGTLIVGSTVVLLGDLSGAQSLEGYFSSQGIQDNIYSIIKGDTIAVGIALVALYYGYKARGGPVGVGNAVARAMIVNLVLIHVVAAFWSAV